MVVGLGVGCVCVYLSVCKKDVCNLEGYRMGIYLSYLYAGYVLLFLAQCVNELIGMEGFGLKLSLRFYLASGICLALV